MKVLTKMVLRRLRKAARPYLETYGLVGAASVFSRSLVLFTPAGGNVLVLAPHMDDETLGCGGTLRRHADAGAHITVAYLTDGARGSSALAAYQGEERARRERELSAARKDEARAACALLGVARIEFLDAPDGRVLESPNLVPRLRELLLQVRPQLLYLPFFLEEHADHRAASRVLLDAIAGTGVDCQCMGYEVWTPLFPNCVVKIEATMEAKRQAIQCYRSQLVDFDYLHKITGLNAYRSVTLAGRDERYAEVFFSASLADYRRLYGDHARR